jgi:hypothetical protein
LGEWVDALPYFIIADKLETVDIRFGGKIHEDIEPCDHDKFQL